MEVEKTYTVTELAELTKRSRWYIFMMKRAGFQFDDGHRCSYECYRNWMKSNMGFVAHDYADMPIDKRKSVAKKNSHS